MLWLVWWLGSNEPLWSATERTKIRQASIFSAYNSPHQLGKEDHSVRKAMHHNGILPSLQFWLTESVLYHRSTGNLTIYLSGTFRYHRIANGMKSWQNNSSIWSGIKWNTNMPWAFCNFYDMPLISAKYPMMKSKAQNCIFSDRQNISRSKNHKAGNCWRLGSILRSYRKQLQYILMRTRI